MQTPREREADRKEESERERERGKREREGGREGGREQERELSMCCVPLCCHIKLDIDHCYNSTIIFCDLN